jgi:hypothetical protein
MNERERTHDERQRAASSGSPAGPDGSGLQAAAQSATAYLAAAQSAINQVLSGNSLAFNNAIRQRGGQ